MSTFTIQIAGCVVAVDAMFDSTKQFCADYLCSCAPDFSVKTSWESIRFERETSAREDRLEGCPERVYSDAYLETVAVQRLIAEKLFDYDVLLFHGSVISVDGHAYLFTARSGTGKSTHARLWREMLGDRAVMVNDDKPFLRITEDGILACGSPWNGKHRLGTNICVPLDAVCILERGSENIIKRLHPKDAVFMLLQQSNRPADNARMPKYLDLIDKLSGRVRFYKLNCTMDPQAAEISFESMKTV